MCCESFMLGLYKGQWNSIRPVSSVTDHACLLVFFCLFSKVSPRIKSYFYAKAVFILSFKIYLFPTLCCRLSKKNILLSVLGPQLCFLAKALQIVCLYGMYKINSKPKICSQSGHSRTHWQPAFFYWSFIKSLPKTEDWPFLKGLLLFYVLSIFMSISFVFCRHRHGANFWHDAEAYDYW